MTPQEQRIVDLSLRADGHPVQIVTLRSADYLKWLTSQNLPNTAANRAAFITL